MHDLEHYTLLMQKIHVSVYIYKMWQTITGKGKKEREIII